MKIRLSELKKIIQEETQAVQEYDDYDQAQVHGQHEVGTLLDVDKLQRAIFELTSLYTGAMTDAMGPEIDIGDEYEAREMVNLAVQTMFDAWLEKQQPKRR